MWVDRQTDGRRDMTKPVVAVRSGVAEVSIHQVRDAVFGRVESMIRRNVGYHSPNDTASLHARLWHRLVW